jgi:hypothetical protein
VAQQYGRVHGAVAVSLSRRQRAHSHADTWAELFNTHHLGMPDLIAAVKKRAASLPEAPEPAEIIAFARAIRQARDNEHGPSDAYEALCESKAADADELAQRRAARALAPKVEHPKLPQLVDTIANRKRTI